MQRPYVSDEQRMGGLAEAPVTKWLLIFLVAGGVLDILLKGGVRECLAMEPAAVNRGQVWRVVSSVLVPVDLLSLIIHAFVLSSLGSVVEKMVLGSRRMLGLLFWVVLVGGLLAYVVSGGMYLGARGIVYGVLTVLMLKMPDQRVRLSLVNLEVRLGTICVVFIGIGVVMGLLHQGSVAMSVGSLSAVLVVWILFQRPQWMSIFQSRKGNFRKKKVVQTRVKKIKARTKLDLSDTEVDRILDKVNESGLGSLTQYERDVLKFAADDDR